MTQIAAKLVSAALGFNHQTKAIIRQEINMENEKQYCWSWNDEEYDSGTFNSIGDALEDACECADDETEVYIGEVVPFSNSSFYPDGSWVTEHMQEQAWCNGGDYAEYYVDVSKEAIDELTDELSGLLDNWCKKHGVSPKFHRVINSKQYAINNVKN